MSNGGSIDEGRAERERRKNFESPFDRFAIGGIRLKPNHEKRKKEMNEKDEKQNKKRTEKQKTAGKKRNEEKKRRSTRVARREVVRIEGVDSKSRGQRIETRRVRNRGGERRWRGGDEGNLL